MISFHTLLIVFTINEVEIGRDVYKSTRALVREQCILFAVALAGFAMLWGLLLHTQPVNRLSTGVLVWWTALCAVSIVNLCGWRLSAATVARRKATVPPPVYLFQRRQLILSAVYVLGCGFRSILPRADVQRIGLLDSWVSSVMVGRSVATVAELCFVVQWALLLYATARATGTRSGVVISRALVPLILVAELCSWYAVLTTSYLGNVIEESLWALAASLMVVTCLTLWPRCHAAGRSFLSVAAALGTAYVVFMCTVDVPMYLSRWLADTAAGRPYLSFGQGVWDVWSRRHVTFAWQDWQTEIPWMSLYFSIAVWCSIALVHAPRFAPMLRRAVYDRDQDRFCR